MSQSLHVLLIDDSKANRQLFCAYAERSTTLPVVVAEAATGAAGLALLRTTDYDCIYLDYVLPDINGLELLRQLRREFPDTPVVVLTGQGSEPVAVEAMKLGAADYLPKSDLTPEVLHRSLHSARQLAAAQRQSRAATHDMRRAQAETQRAQQAQGEFFTRMSHEIRTPLNVILGTLELLKSTAVTPEQEPLLLTCQRASHMLMVLINDILDFSKSQTGELELKNLEFNLRETFANTCAMMAVQAQGKELRFTHSFSPELPDWAMGDADRLMQILVNLIANAIKFTHHGEVCVTAEPDPSAGAHRVGVRLRVSDTGIGIAPDKQEIIFAGFQQADKSVSRLYGGTGLGLAITKSLVSKMGGDIAVESALGQGSAFTITLRFGRAAAPAPAPAAETAPATTPTPGLRILVAEDTYDNRMLLQSFLRHTNHALDFAFNGRDACTRFQTQPYDLILMDMEMPEMNGLAATAEIRACERRENRPPTPIIALTAHSFSEEREKCLAAGCSDFLSKPFKRQMLLDKLRQHTRPARA